MEQSTAEVPKQEATETPEPPKQDGSLESAAAALSGLLSDAGSMPEESEEDAPQGQAASEVAEPAKVEKVPSPDEGKTVPNPISLKIGDKEYSIPANDIPEEIREVVKDGLLMRADYTRKTQELAEGRKVIEARAQEVMGAFQAVNTLPAQLAQIQSVEAQLQRMSDPALWQRLESDPLGKIEAKQAYHDLVNQRQALYGQAHQAQQQMNAYMAKQANERAQLALPKVKEAIPDFGPEKAKEMRAYAKTLGFSDQQLDQTYDAGPLILLHKAMEFDRLQSKQAETQKKVEKLPPKQVKSGVSQDARNGPTMNQSAFSRLQKTGKTDDAAAVIKSLLG